MTSAIPAARSWRWFVSTALAVAVTLALTFAIIRSKRSGDVPRVVVGTKDVVYYTRRATRQDAQALGRALQSAGYLKDRGTGVILAKGSAGAAISFVLNDGAWDQPDAISNYGEIGRQIAPSVGGFPLRISLVDEKLAVRKSLVVGMQTIGTRDSIYYYGSATREEAVALGEFLRSTGAIKDNGSTVLLAKGDLTTISFVVKQMPWERPEVMAAFESLLRKAAPTVGGLPLKLRLLDSGGVVHKEMSIL